MIDAFMNVKNEKYNTESDLRQDSWNETTVTLVNMK